MQGRFRGSLDFDVPSGASPEVLSVSLIVIRFSFEYGLHSDYVWYHRSIDFRHHLYCDSRLRRHALRFGVLDDRVPWVVMSVRSSLLLEPRSTVGEVLQCIPS